MVKKLIIYGAGKICSVVYDMLTGNEDLYYLVAICDSNLCHKNVMKFGRCVQSPDIIEEYPDALVCIAIANKKTVSLIRKEKKWKNKEVLYSKILLELYLKEWKSKIKLRRNDFKDTKTVFFDCFNGLGLGGVESWTSDVCQRIILSGHDNIRIIADADRYEIPYTLKGHIDYADQDHDFPYNKTSINNVVKIILSYLPVEIVTATVDEILLAACIVKQCCPDAVKILSVIHNSNDHVYREYEGYKEHIDLFLPVSSDIENNLKIRGYDASKIMKLLLPFRMKEKVERNYSSGGEPIVVGYAGRLEEQQKRCDLFVKLIEQLEQRKVNYKFLIAGNGSYKGILKEYIITKGYHGHVELAGYIGRETILDFWEKVDLCVNLSDYEGRSLSILEAMGSGAVPLVTDTSGVHDDIISGVNGYIVPLGRFDRIADYIELLGKDRMALKKMGKEARESVKAKGDLSEHVKVMKTILNL